MSYINEHFTLEMKEKAIKSTQWERKSTHSDIYTLAILFSLINPIK